MTSNNKKNRPADAPKTATAKPAVPTDFIRTAAEAGVSLPKAEEKEPHPLDTAMGTFVAACAAYVDESGSNRSTVVGPYRLAFNGPQLISVTHV